MWGADRSKSRRASSSREHSAAAAARRVSVCAVNAVAPDTSHASARLHCSIAACQRPSSNAAVAACVCSWMRRSRCSSATHLPLSGRSATCV